MRYGRRFIAAALTSTVPFAVAETMTAFNGHGLVFVLWGVTTSMATLVLARRSIIAVLAMLLASSVAFAVWWAPDAGYPVTLIQFAVLCGAATGFLPVQHDRERPGRRVGRPSAMLALPALATALLLALLPDQPWRVLTHMVGMAALIGSAVAPRPWDAVERRTASATERLTRWATSGFDVAGGFGRGARDGTTRAWDRSRAVAGRALARGAGCIRRVIRVVSGDRPRRRLVMALGALVVVVIVAVVIDVVVAWRGVERVQFEPTGSGTGGETFLFIGSDSRESLDSVDDVTRYGGERTPGERADVLFAVRVDEGGSTRILSVPRDLVVYEPAGGAFRVALALEGGGPQAIADLLCSNLGLGVDHVVIAKLAGFRSIVDAAGGVEIELDRPVRDLGSGLELDAGLVQLDGDDVLAFIGARNLEERGADGQWRRDPEDAGDRQGRAYEVLYRVAERVSFSPADPIGAHRTMWAVSGALAVDEGLGLGDVDTLRSVLRGLSQEDRLSLPVNSSGGDINSDELAAGAGAVLSRFEGTSESSGPCADPDLDAARRL